MKVIVAVNVIACCLLGTAEAFIVPDELPSILSVVYSNIPTIKKGTDSRLGWGFRLGDRADFQVMVELGPQQYTQPLANQGDSGTNKRNALNNLANQLYAQRQHEKRLREKKKLEEEKKKAVEDIELPKSSDANPQGAEWLQKWSKSISKQTKKKETPLEPKPGLSIGEIDAKSVIPEDEDDRKLKKQSSNIKLLKVASTTSKQDALDNVDLS